MPIISALHYHGADFILRCEEWAFAIWIAQKSTLLAFVYLN